jgi:translocation and assembly module TamB
VNGRIVFEPGGVRFDALAGEMGNGRVQFGGRVGLSGYTITELGVTAAGRDMRLRYPEGFRSVIDADLTLSGTLDDQLLTGTVNVTDAVWVEPVAEGRGLFDLAARDSSMEETVQPDAPTMPLRYDLRILAPSSLRISDNTTRIVSSAELTLRGTYDAPLVFGNAEIERGEVFFEGNRYRVTRGTIDFANPTRIEPFFDVEAETDVRVPGQTYRVTFRLTGTLDRLVPELSSDPPLPQVDILALLLGDVRDPQEAELRALRTPDATQQQLMQAGAARLLTSTLSSGVGRVVERSFGVDTFEITPALADPSTQQSAQLNPTARLLIGKRISDRVHLTLSRALTGAERDLIVVLEYDQSDRWSWVLSQNEDQTYALDFRMRHAF